MSLVGPSRADALAYRLTDLGATEASGEQRLTRLDAGFPESDLLVDAAGIPAAWIDVADRCPASIQVGIGPAGLWIPLREPTRLGIIEPHPELQQGEVGFLIVRVIPQPAHILIRLVYPVGVLIVRQQCTIGIIRIPVGDRSTAIRQEPGRAKLVEVVVADALGRMHPRDQLSTGLSDVVDARAA